MIESLNRKHAGAYLNGIRVNHLIFADDVFICSVTLSGLEELYRGVEEFFAEYGDLKLNLDKSVILRVGTRKLEAQSFADIPTAKTARYLGANLFSQDSSQGETSRCYRHICYKTNELLKNHLHLPLLDSTSKKSIIAAYSKPYAFELLPGINSNLRRAHRYMVSTLHPETNYDEHGKKRQYVTSSELYGETGVTPLPTAHQQIRNKMILNARESENKLIRGIVGSLELVTDSDVLAMLKSNTKTMFRYGKRD